MPEYKKLSEIPPTDSPSSRATLIAEDGGKDYRIPLRNLLYLDRSITGKTQLPAPADSAIGDTKMFLNPARDTFECWEFRPDNNWHQTL